MYEAIGIIVLNAVIFFATGYIIGKSRRYASGGVVKQSMLRDGGVPTILTYGGAASRDCSHPTELQTPIIWSQDGWVATCRRCRAFLYFGDQDYPAVGAKPLSVTPYSRYESNPGGDDRVRDAVTVRGGMVWIDDILAPEVTSDERPVFSDECGLGEPLPDFLAGLIDANGNVSWRDGVSLTYGVVLIWPSQRAAAIDNGWAVIGEEPDGKLRVTRDYKPDGYPWVEVPFPSWDGPTPDPRQNTAALVAEIELGRDPDAGEPVVMPPQPNLGGEGNPQYEGGNYTHETHLADEMKRVIHFRRDDDDGEES